MRCGIVGYSVVCVVRCSEVCVVHMCWLSCCAPKCWIVCISVVPCCVAYDATQCVW